MDCNWPLWNLATALGSQLQRSQQFERCFPHRGKGNLLVGKAPGGPVGHLQPQVKFSSLLLKGAYWVLSVAKP